MTREKRPRQRRSDNFARIPISAAKLSIPHITEGLENLSALCFSLINHLVSSVQLFALRQYPTSTKAKIPFHQKALVYKIVLYAIKTIMNGKGRRPIMDIRRILTWMN